MVTVHVFVHPVDTTRFPSVPSGFRWCVQLGPDPADDRVWCNAGWAPTVGAAELDGATVGVAVARAFQLANGIPAHHVVTRLETDPTTNDVVFNELPRKV